MKLTDYQKKFLELALIQEMRQIENFVLVIEKQFKEEKSISKNIFLRSNARNKKQIQELKELQNYFDLDINKY